MKSLMVVMLTGCVAASAAAGEITVQRVQGDVEVRNGVTLAWTPLAAGALLAPEASVRTGTGAAAVLMASDGNDRRTITLPPEVILDVADLRVLSREDLILKLTMQKVRSAPYRWKDGAPSPSGTTVVHGADGSARADLDENDPAVGKFMLNGARVLFENGFYSTSALRALDVFRRHPALGGRFADRWMVAEALERARLRGEALSEYSALAREEFLTDAERDRVRAKQEELKRVKSEE